MTLPTTTKRRRLEGAGFAALRVGDDYGWVPAAFAERARAQIEAHKADVERVLAEPRRPRGRPRKSPDLA